MNKNMKGMLFNIVETIQPALQETVGPENRADMKVTVTPKNQALSQGSSKVQEYEFKDTRRATDPKPQATLAPAPAPVVATAPVAA